MAMDEDKVYLASILKTALSFDSSIQKMIDESKQIKNEALREEMMKAVGYVMKEITLKIVFPIFKRYPDLDNEK
jgi:hypothetical protein